MEKNPLEMPNMPSQQPLLVRWHLDLPLMLGLLMCLCLSLFVLYSASGQHVEMLERQVVRTGLAFGAMIVVAQIPPKFLLKLAPYAYLAGLALLIMVELFGDISKGAQRWLNLGFMRLQPSEFLKLIIPLTMAAFLTRLPCRSCGTTFCTITKSSAS